MAEAAGAQQTDTVLHGSMAFGQHGLGVIRGELVEDAYVVIDHPDFNVAVGFARGVDRWKMIPDPSTRNGLRFLLGRVRRLLKAGVDGIHLRLQHHLQFVGAQFYGYSDAVVAEYNRRHGTDITDGLPDRERFEEVHGDFYTEFYRRTRELADFAGVNVILAVPEVQGFMCELPVRLQWDRWIGLGLADAIMLKNVYPGTMLGEALRVLTRRHNMPLYFNPYDDRGGGGPGRQQRYERLLARSIDAGHDGYNRYEGHCILRRGRAPGSRWCPSGGAAPTDDEPDFVIRWSDDERQALLSLASVKIRSGPVCD